MGKGWLASQRQHQRGASLVLQRLGLERELDACLGDRCQIARVEQSLLGQRDEAHCRHLCRALLIGRVTRPVDPLLLDQIEDRAPGLRERGRAAPARDVVGGAGIRQTAEQQHPELGLGLRERDLRVQQGLAVASKLEFVDLGLRAATFCSAARRSPRALSAAVASALRSSLMASKRAFAISPAALADSAATADASG